MCDLCMHMCVRSPEFQLLNKEQNIKKTLFPLEFSLRTFKEIEVQNDVLEHICTFRHHF